MKRIIVFLAVSLLLVPVFSQNVTIPDANFLAALIHPRVDTNKDGQISYAEAEGVQELNIYTKSISDLTGIEAFVNLEHLHCSHNQLTSLDVSNNTALEYLNCSDNQLTSLDVSNNTALDIIYCSENQLTSLDVSSCTALRELGCSSNQLSSLDVSNNPALETLSCSENQLTSLDVSNNPTLANPCSLPLCDREYDLGIGFMPTLYQVCVWETFFTDSVEVDTTGSPNVCFDTICDGTCPSSDTSTIFPQFKMEEQISIYPNPTNSLLTIETDNDDCYSIEIHSLNGQLIYKEEMEGNSMQIDMTPFTKGIYFITVTSDAWVRTEKVVKY